MNNGSHQILHWWDPGKGLSRPDCCSNRCTSLVFFGTASSLPSPESRGDTPYTLEFGALLRFSIGICGLLYFDHQYHLEMVKTMPDLLGYNHCKWMIFPETERQFVGSKFWNLVYIGPDMVKANMWQGKTKRDICSPWLILCQNVDSEWINIVTVKLSILPASDSAMLKNIYTLGKSWSLSTWFSEPSEGPRELQRVMETRVLVGISRLPVRESSKGHPALQSIKRSINKLIPPQLNQCKLKQPKIFVTSCYTTT